MSSNPYDPNANAYGGGNPYGGQPQPGGGPQPQGQSFPIGPPFVDPYQPPDRQPTYPPAITRAELSAQGGVSGGATSVMTALNRGSAGSSGMAMVSGPGRGLAVTCLVFAAILTLGHAALLALGMAAIIRATSSTTPAKTWAANCFNFLLTYIVLVVVMYVGFGMDSGGMSSTQSFIAGTVRTLFSGLFVVGAIAAAKGSFFRFPGQIPAMKY